MPPSTDSGLDSSPDSGPLIWPSPALPRAPLPPSVPWSVQARTYAGLWRRRLALTTGRAPVDGTRFVVFAQGRTGSTLLVDLLDHIGGVHCDEEILEAPVRFPDSWVEAHRLRHADSAYGFKVKIVQLVEAQNITDPGAWLRGMHGRGWRIVHLWRRNLLRQVLSTMVAEQRGSFVIRDQAPTAVGPLVTDAAHLIHWMRVLQAVGTAERAALATVPHTTVCYEDDLIEPSRQQETLDRLAAFLGRPPGAARTDVQRTVAGPLSDVVANADEVIADLRGTEWERFLD